MEKRKDNEGEIEKEEANNSLVLFSSLRKDIANVLDFLERSKNEENQKALDMDQVEKLKSELAFICTYIQLSYSDLEQFEDVMTAKGQEVENLLRSILYDVDNNVACKYDMHHVLASLRDNIDNFISSHHRSKSSATMLEEQLNFLLLNLHHLSKLLAEHKFPLVTQYEILQNVCGDIKDFYGLIVNGCVEHEIVEYVLPQFQLMAERVGHFLWEDQTDEDSQLSELDEDDQTDEDSQLSELDKDDQTDEDSQHYELDEDDQTDEDSQLYELDEDNQNDSDSRHFKLPHLLLKIVPIELEVMHICYTNLKASTSVEIGCFIKQLLETSPDILREYLIHLQEHMITVITPSICFHFPSNLKKMLLCDFPLTSDSLSTIARLPNLEELYLYGTIIHGEEWNMGEEDTFENLKFLKLEQLTLSKWEVGEESFPTLKKLKLEGCCDLEEIPPSFGDINSLKIIKLVKSLQLEDSAMKIKEYAEDMRGGDELQVVGRKNIPLFN